MLLIKKRLVQKDKINLSLNNPKRFATLIF